MSENNKQGIELYETDIIFNCPECDKSLAIDERGAGLMIACPDCSARIRVPLRDESDTDTDAGESDTARVETGAVLENDPGHTVQQLRDKLSRAEARLEDLAEEREELRKRRDHLENLRVEHLTTNEKISEEITVIQAALDRMVDILQQSHQSSPR